MPRTYKPRPKLWSEASVEAALSEVSAGASVRFTAKKYCMSVSMLRRRYLASQNLITLGHRGGRPRLPATTEEKLAGYIRRMAACGFGPTLDEFKSIVHDYLCANEINDVFTDNMPGSDWTSLFMKRHRLSLKKAGLMQIARKNVTADPFVIYNFYDMLEREVERLGISNRPECFWNLDESGFPTDPSRWKTIGPTGAKTIRVSCGANRENTTVLAVCCADGTALDPLIVFKGKNIMSNWRGSKALHETFYAVSDSGWMTTTIFYEWFQHFCEKTKNIRPLILIFDGHLTHTSTSVIELAEAENITIIKLPAHTTDTLQPLDVACFNPLKSYYEKSLTERVHATGAREPLKKAAFVNLLSSIWHKGMSATNITAGFCTTGIYPVDRTKYKVDRLDKVKLASYDRWVAAGKPSDEAGEAIVPSVQPVQWNVPEEHVPAEVSPPSSTVCSPIAGPSGISTPSASAVTPKAVLGVQMPSTSSADKLAYRQLVAQLQKYAPSGCKFVVECVPEEDEVSFEKVIKSRGRPSSAPTEPAKRHRISMHGSILTNKEFMKQEIKKNPPPKAKKTLEMTSDDSSPSEPDSDSVHQDDSDSDISDIEIDENYSKNLKAAIERDIISKQLPRASEIEVGKMYAVRYDQPLAYYWGEVISNISDSDSDTNPTTFRLKFMKRVHVTGTPRERKYDWPKVDDFDNISADRFIAGPHKPYVVSNTKRGGGFFSFGDGEEIADYRIKQMQTFGVPSPQKK